MVGGVEHVRFSPRNVMGAAFTLAAAPFALHGLVSAAQGGRYAAGRQHCRTVNDPIPIRGKRSNSQAPPSA
jgi:hypothetical protein